MKIAVCEDEAADRKKLCELIGAYCARHAMDAEIIPFQTGAELLRRMQSVSFAVVFLDIYLEQEHGVEIAKAIRKQNQEVILFFCTISKEFALEGYQVNALHYLVKPISYSHVENAMNRCGDRLFGQTRTLLLSPKKQTQVFVKDILYVEVFDKVCFVHTPGGVEPTRKTIQQLEEELGPECFLRCHRSYIVNLEHVERYGDADFVLHNGVSIPIRQAGRGRIKQAFRHYAALKIAQTV